MPCRENLGVLGSATPERVKSIIQAKVTFLAQEADNLPASREVVCF